MVPNWTLNILINMGPFWNCALVLCIMAFFFAAFPMEGFTMDHQCHCLSTTNDYINSRWFQRIEILPAGSHCRKTEIMWVRGIYIYGVCFENIGYFQCYISVYVLYRITCHIIITGYGFGFSQCLQKFWMLFYIYYTTLCQSTARILFCANLTSIVIK